MKKHSREKKTMKFRIGADRAAELDEVAEARCRDRAYLLNEAVEAYLELNRWQIEHIREGLRRAKGSRGVPHAEVVAKWRPRLRSGSIRLLVAYTK